MSIINTADIGKLKKTKVAKAGDTMTGTLAFGDNVKATFGALAGGDLQIFHDAGNSWIKDTGTGSLILSGANDVNIKGDNGERLAQFNQNGSVDLFYNNVQKLATTATGVDVTGTITCDGFTSADASSTFSNSASNLEVNFIANNSVIINTTSGTSEGTIIRCNKYYRIDTGGSVERLRIDASGNVGIGTNNPTNLLTCESTTPPQVSIKYDTTNYLNISHNKFEVVGSDFTINAFNSQSVILQTSNIERVRIDSSGNMGVGITPTEKLHVSGNIKVSGTVDGRDLATDGTKLDTVETNADVTDTANVTTAGALMTAGGAMTGAVTTSSTFDGRDVATDGTKLDTVETNADVTDTANVTTAGALMTAGGTLTGNLNLGDNNKAQFGASNDLQIYSDGAFSWIKESGPGDLIVQGTDVRIRNSAGFDFIRCVEGHHTALYYGNNNSGVKLETTSTGINVNGSVSIDNGVATIASGTGTVSNAEMTLDTWAATEFQSAKYTITARGNGNKFQTSEILVFHDNANTAYITEYGIMSSDGTPFVTYLVDVTSGNVRLRATLDAAWSGGDNVKFTRFAQDII